MDMSFFGSLFRIYQHLLLLGTVIHELSHAIAVKLCGGQIEELALASHVNHRGHYNLGQQIIISYAPIVVNTAVAAGLSQWAVGISDSHIPQTIADYTGSIISSSIAAVGIQILVFILALVIAAAALPSYTDARNPYSTFRQRLGQLTLLRIITLPVALFVLVIGIIPLAFAYLRSQNAWLHLVSEVGFATAILLQATGTVVIVDPLSAIDLINQVHDSSVFS